MRSPKETVTEHIPHTAMSSTRGGNKILIQMRSRKPPKGGAETRSIGGGSRGILLSRIHGAQRRAKIGFEENLGYRASGDLRGLCPGSQ